MKTKTRKIALMLGVAVMVLGSANTAMADSWKHGPSRGSFSDKRGHGGPKGPSKHHNNKPVHYKEIYRPSPHYHTPQRTVIYYNSGPYYPTTYYRESYVQPRVTYVVGGYLPRDREWHPIHDHARYGLRSPGRGERWVYADRDAFLISEATSRIISGLVLAAAVNR